MKSKSRQNQTGLGGNAEVPSTPHGFQEACYLADLRAERDTLRAGPITPRAAQRLLEIQQRLKEVTPS